MKNEENSSKMKPTTAKSSKPGSSKNDRIKPQMAVVCANNTMFATVDHVEGNSLKLTKDNKGQHHYIPLDWIKSIDDKVHVDRSDKQAMSDWSMKPLP